MIITMTVFTLIFGGIINLQHMRIGTPPAKNRPAVIQLKASGSYNDGAQSFTQI